MNEETLGRRRPYMPHICPIYIHALIGFEIAIDIVNNKLFHTDRICVDNCIHLRVFVGNYGVRNA